MLPQGNGIVPRKHGPGSTKLQGRWFPRSREGREFDEREKWVFGICHGVQVLASAGLATGACMTAYEHCRTDVELGGGEYVADRQAVRHGRIVTGQTWQSHPEFYREVMSCLGSG